MSRIIKSLDKIKIFQKVIIVDSAGKILALRRAKENPRRGNCWDLPGGNYEKGEHIIDSVIREAYEETSLKIKEPQVIYLDHGRVGDEEEVDVLAISYVCYDFDGDVTLSREHYEFQWVDPKGFLTLNFGDDGGFLAASIRAWQERV